MSEIRVYVEPDKPQGGGTVSQVSWETLLSRFPLHEGERIVAVHAQKDSVTLYFERGRHDG